MKKKDKLISGAYPIEEVQIGLDTARLKLVYADTFNLVKDGDFAYKISLPTAIGEGDIYFEDYLTFHLCLEHT